MAAVPETDARRPVRRRVLVGIGLAVTVVFGYVAVRNARPGEVWAALADSQWIWIAPAFAALVLAIALRTVRWWLLFAAETRPPLGAVGHATLIGYFFNNVLPLRAGEAARVVALGRRAGSSRAEAAATVVLERAYDVGAVLALLFVLLPWLPEVTWLRGAGALALALLASLVGAAAVLAIFGERPFRRLLRPLSRVPLFDADRAAANLAQGLAGLRRAGLAATAFTVTVVSWVVLGISSWLLMLAFDLGLSPVAGIFVMVATALAAVLPSSPAGVGVFEAAVVVALSAYGVNDSEALSYALVLHAVNFVPFIAAGLVVLRR